MDVIVPVKKVNNEECFSAHDYLAEESPLEISIAYEQEGEPVDRKISVTMRTPGNDHELAAGFLFTEGIITHASQVESIDMDASQLAVKVKLKPGVIPNLTQTQRNFISTASCGACGKVDINSLRIQPQLHITNELQVAADFFTGLEEQLLKQQTLFSQTGGLHASALFDSSGNLKSTREDVGRHNALDKVIGAAFLNNDLPISNDVLLLSGRVGFELIQKAAMAGIQIVAAVGAPSSMAVTMAREYKITLIGFLRNGKFNIYTGEERIRLNVTV